MTSQSQHHPFSYPTCVLLNPPPDAGGHLQQLRPSSCPCDCVSGQAAAVRHYTGGERKCKECSFSLLSTPNTPPPTPHPPKRGIIRYMFPVLVGNVISVAHLTVCEVHFFLKSKENDLFSLLFLSDLIGHSTHFPEWHL